MPRLRQKDVLIFTLFFILSCIVREVLRLLHLSYFINTIILVGMSILFHEFSVKLEEAHVNSRLAVIYALFKIVL
jgi:hypothetical protein